MRSSALNTLVFLSVLSHAKFEQLLNGPNAARQLMQVDVTKAARLITLENTVFVSVVIGGFATCHNRYFPRNQPIRTSFDFVAVHLA